jgi:bifunctional enzyme CysN/CysC/sulfate adenylyltransferase subunit 1
MIACDPFVENRETGGFILIDRITNETAAVGMVKTVASSLSRPAPSLTDLSYASMEGVASPANVNASRTWGLGKSLAFGGVAGLVTFGVAAAFAQDAGLATRIALAETVAIVILHYLFEKLWRRPQTPSASHNEPTPFEGEGL